MTLNNQYARYNSDIQNIDMSGERNNSIPLNLSNERNLFDRHELLNNVNVNNYFLDRRDFPINESFIPRQYNLYTRRNNISAPREIINETDERSETDNIEENIINTIRGNNVINPLLSFILATLRENGNLNEGLNEARIEELNELEYDNEKSKNLSQELKTCSICMCDYENGDKLKLLQCTHRFHKDCITEWLKKKGLCPVCKCDV